MSPQAGEPSRKRLRDDSGTSSTNDDPSAGWAVPPFIRRMYDSLAFPPNEPNNPDRRPSLTDDQVSTFKDNAWFAGEEIMRYKNEARVDRDTIRQLQRQIETLEKQVNKLDKMLENAQTALNGVQAWLPIYFQSYQGVKACLTTYDAAVADVQPNTDRTLDSHDVAG